VSCNDHGQDLPSGTVLRCWFKHTCFTLQGELVIWMQSVFPAKFLHALATLLFLVSASACCLERSRYANLLTEICIRPFSLFYRTQFLWEFKFIMALFKSPCSCRCLR
jgi:hypothetical protein